MYGLRYKDNGNIGNIGFEPLKKSQKEEYTTNLEKSKNLQM